MIDFYGCAGEYGLCVLTNYNAYQNMKKYLGRRSNCKKFLDSTEAESYAIGRYNDLNSNYPEAQYHGSLEINKLLCRSGIKEMNKQLRSAPIDLVNWS